MKAMVKCGKTYNKRARRKNFSGIGSNEDSVAAILISLFFPPFFEVLQRSDQRKASQHLTIREQALSGRNNSQQFCLLHYRCSIKENPKWP